MACQAAGRAATGGQEKADCKVQWCRGGSLYAFHSGPGRPHEANRPRIPATSGAARGCGQKMAAKQRCLHPLLVRPRHACHSTTASRRDRHSVCLCMPPTCNVRQHVVTRSSSSSLLPLHTCMWCPADGQPEHAATNAKHPSWGGLGSRSASLIDSDMTSERCSAWPAPTEARQGRTSHASAAQLGCARRQCRAGARVRRSSLQPSRHAGGQAAKGRHERAPGQPPALSSYRRAWHSSSSATVQ